MSLPRRTQENDPQTSENQPSELTGTPHPDPVDSRSGDVALKSRLRAKVAEQLHSSAYTHPLERRIKIEECFSAILAEESISLSFTEKELLLETILVEIDSGPLAALLADDAITEIMVNGPNHVYAVQNGHLSQFNVDIPSEKDWLRILNQMLMPLGERIDAAHPIVEVRLPGNLKVNAVVRPIALSSPTITIRKLSREFLSADDLVRLGSMTAECAELLHACVVAGLNIVVSGGGGASGMTTLLNVLANYIPDEQRIITIERNSPELRLRQEQAISLISRPANRQGQDEVSVRDLVNNAAFMCPDWLVLGECHSGEVYDLLQMMSAGHAAILTSVRSASPFDALRRLEYMCLMSGEDLPTHTLRELIASTVAVVVHLERFRDGSRRIVQVAEVQALHGDAITLSSLLEFEQTGAEAGKIMGRLRPTGVRPRFLDRIEEAGIHLPLTVFGISANPRASCPVPK